MPVRNERNGISVGAATARPWLHHLAGWLGLLCLSSALHAETVFLEAETFRSAAAGGWTAGPATKPHLASGGRVLRKSPGGGAATASRDVTLAEAGRYHVWVRYMQTAAGRHPFRLAVSHGGSEVAAKVFDLAADAQAGLLAERLEEFEADGETDALDGRWDTFAVDLPAGRATLSLGPAAEGKGGGSNCQVDCVLLTRDEKLKPDHRDYGPQTYLRITAGPGYDEPMYVHAFVPFVGHFNLSKAGFSKSTTPRPLSARMLSGENTGWCNISRMLYPDLRVGARLTFTARRVYNDILPRLNAVFEFATAPAATSVVKRLAIDYQPGTLYLCLPTDLASPANLARFTVDAELAERTGRQADAFAWPAFGRKPTRYPFFSSFHADPRATFTPDARIVARERKTLDYFGFVDERMTFVNAGTWLMLGNSYCDPDVASMRRAANERAQRLKDSGRFTVDDIVFAKLMDEPGARRTSMIVADPAYRREMLRWLRDEARLTPADLLVKTWDEVRPVGEDERDAFPALHYYTQRLRPRALSRFMATQAGVIAEAFGRPIPCMGNFSDVTVYSGNLYRNGADYFELLDAAPQSALWSECGGALASTSQCTDYNVDLMRGAALTHPVQLGHYLISYGRPIWDVKCKAVGHAARGVKVLMDYYYGPTWHGYEGGPTWKTGAWYAHPEKWLGMAELLREFGGAEDLLVPALPPPAQVAILYNSASDIWTLNRNHAYGFDRMHLWLALQHAQVPVDILSEAQVTAGLLSRYRACYLTGPNLTRSAAAQTAAWVAAGGVLYLTAGAGSRDEYNRPLAAFDALLPAKRQPLEELDGFLNYGSALRLLPVRDHVGAAAPAGANVIGVRQSLTPADATAEVLAAFANGAPALVGRPHGRGRVFQAGFLPGLSYVHPALAAREAHVARLAQAGESGSATSATDRVVAEILARSRNPWEFPAEVRELILAPVRAAAVDPPVRCSVPLVEAGYMVCPQGVVMPLANYTLQPLADVAFTVHVTNQVRRVESVRQGRLPFEVIDASRVAFHLPLADTDFVMLRYDGAR
jgi:hypothetical protein